MNKKVYLMNLCPSPNHNGASGSCEQPLKFQDNWSGTFTSGVENIPMCWVLPAILGMHQFPVSSSNSVECADSQKEIFGERDV